MARSVRTIPATVSRFTAAPLTSTAKRKVAAYARVSTDHEEQASSYEAQVDYYTEYIKGRDDWEFVSVYADEGISGTSTSKREGFNHMIEDALAGKIDLIITKSVSRFARNTVDSLTTIRKLKENSVECFFEKENIWTFDSKGELLITIMSSIAQEESRSISENVTWGHRKRFSDGKAMVPFGRFLGFERGEDGNLVVNQEQAKTVKLIYKLFLEGLSPYKVAKKLTEMGIPTPGGKEKWSQSCVRSILTNEKYKGDALLQKVFTTDYLTKKKKKNEGEVPQYYVEDNHEAIIDAETFDLVQMEMARRKAESGRYSGVGIFASKIRCGECGNWYGSKVWHSTDKYRRVIYQCNHKFKNEKKCSTPHLTEEEIKEAYLKAVNRYLSEKDELLANAEIMSRIASNTDRLKEKLLQASAEMNGIAEMVQEIVDENARVAQNQEVYNIRFEELVSKYEAAEKKVKELESEITERQSRGKRLQHFIGTMNSLGETQTDFDEGIWNELVEFVMVRSKQEMVFHFFDETELTIS